MGGGPSKEKKNKKKKGHHAQVSEDLAVQIAGAVPHDLQRDLVKPGTESTEVDQDLNDAVRTSRDESLVEDAVQLHEAEEKRHEQAYKEPELATGKSIKDRLAGLEQQRKMEERERVRRLKTERLESEMQAASHRQGEELEDGPSAIHAKISLLTDKQQHGTASKIDREKSQRAKLDADAFQRDPSRSVSGTLGALNEHVVKGTESKMERVRRERAEQEAQQGVVLRKEETIAQRAERMKREAEEEAAKRVKMNRAQRYHKESGNVKEWMKDTGAIDSVAASEVGVVDAGDQDQGPPPAHLQVSETSGSKGSRKSKSSKGSRKSKSSKGSRKSTSSKGSRKSRSSAGSQGDAGAEAEPVDHQVAEDDPMPE